MYYYLVIAQSTTWVYKCRFVGTFCSIAMQRAINGFVLSDHTTQPAVVERVKSQYCLTDIIINC